MRRILIVGNGPNLPIPNADIREVQTLDDALEAAASSDLIMWHSQTADIDVDAVRRLRTLAPVLVVGPVGDVILATEALLAGADDYLEASAMEPSTLHLAIECAVARAQARLEDLERRQDAFQQAVKDREVALRRSLIDHINDRLHNPLTVLNLQTSLLSQCVPASQRTRIDSVQRATKRLQSVIDDIAEAYKATTDDVGDIQPVDVSRVVRNLADGNERKWRLNTPTKWIRSDPAVIESVVRRAMDHAHLVTPTDVPIELRLSGDQETTTIRIGLPTLACDEAFLPFAGMEDLAAEGKLGLELYVARTRGAIVGADVQLVEAQNGCDLVIQLPSVVTAQRSAA